MKPVFNACRKYALALSICLLASLSLASCATNTRVAPDDDGGVTNMGISSQDLRTVSQNMARSLIQIHPIAVAETPPRIAFLPVENRSHEIIDTDMFLNQIRTNLIRSGEGRLQFLDRAQVEAIMMEREANRAGLVAGSEQRDIAGADYFLTGVIESMQQASGHHQTAYFRLAFRLTDAETTAIVWEDDYQMKRASSRAFWDR